MDLHLNYSGALTGGMFIAALLDAFPEHEDRVLAGIDALDGDYPVACFLAVDSDFELQGCRFEIEPFHKYFGHIPLAFSVVAEGDNLPHEHLTWGALRQRLECASLAEPTRAHAMNIFGLLVETESGVQQTVPDRVAFPAVAAWQALAEIIGAAVLIEALQEARWTAAAVSESISPTPAGDAILRYLCLTSGESGCLPKLHTLAHTGVGFGPQRGGQKSFMRVLCFGEVTAVERAHGGAARIAAIDQMRDAPR